MNDQKPSGLMSGFPKPANQHPGTSTGNEDPSYTQPSELAGLSEVLCAVFVLFDRELCESTALWHAWQLARAELLRLVQKAAWLEKQNVEISMNAYQWMARHDRISAGKDGGDFPRPADVPDAITRAERAEAELAELRDEIGTKVPAIMWQHAEAELAALKRRIAEAPVIVGNEAGLEIIAAGWNGVRVALLPVGGEHER